MVKIWNPSLATPAYDEYGGAGSIAGLATELLADSSFVTALALKTDLTEFTYAAYTPVVSQNGNKTASSTLGRYIQVGSHVHCWGSVTVSQAGTAGQLIAVTLPITIHASQVALQLGVGEISVGSAYRGLVAAGGGGANLRFFRDAVTDGNEVGINPSVALASGHTVKWNVTYEAA